LIERVVYNLAIQAPILLFFLDFACEQMSLGTTGAEECQGNECSILRVSGSQRRKLRIQLLNQQLFV